MIDDGFDYFTGNETHFADVIERSLALNYYFKHESIRNFFDDEDFWDDLDKIFTKLETSPDYKRSNNENLWVKEFFNTLSKHNYKIDDDLKNELKNFLEEEINKDLNLGNGFYI